jgi:hypothetical protein
MITRLSLLAFCLSTLPCWAFEGILYQTVKNYNGTGNDVAITYYLKNTLCKVDMITSDKQATVHTIMVYDANTKVAKTYFPSDKATAAEKVYYQINSDQISGSVSNLTSKKTTESKTINTHPADKWIVNSSLGKMDVWIATDIAIDWSLYRDLFKTSPEIQTLIDEGIKGFPIETQGADGKNIGKVDKVSTQTLPNSIFEVPSDYSLSGK